MSRRSVSGGPDPDALAELLCDWCLEVREGDQVLVGMTTAAFPLARALHRAVLTRAAWPLIRLRPEVLGEDDLIARLRAEFDAVDHQPDEEGPA